MSYVLLNALRNKNDEFYTTRESVEDIFNNIIIDKEQFRDKIVYCPCDTDESEFVKYFKENKENLHLKDFIYTSNDFRDNEEIFNKSDIIITNPPFSLLIRYLYPLIRNKKFFIYCHISTLSIPIKEDIINKKVFKINSNTINNTFKNENCDYTSIPTAFLTNMNIRELKNLSLYKKYNPDTAVFCEQVNEKILFIDKLKNIPIDYQGVIAVPETIYCENYLDRFEVIPFIESDKYNKRHYREYSVRPIINNKLKFPKALVKHKNI